MKENLEKRVKQGRKAMTLDERILLHSRQLFVNYHINSWASRSVVLGISPPNMGVFQLHVDIFIMPQLCFKKLVRDLGLVYNAL